MEHTVFMPLVMVHTIPNKLICYLKVKEWIFINREDFLNLCPMKTMVADFVNI